MGRLAQDKYKASFTTPSGFRLEFEEFHLSSNCGEINTTMPIPSTLFYTYLIDKIHNEIEGIVEIKYDTKYRIKIEKGNLFHWKEIINKVFIILTNVAMG